MYGSYGFCFPKNSWTLCRPFSFPFGGSFQVPAVCFPGCTDFSLQKSIATIAAELSAWYLQVICHQLDVGACIVHGQRKDEMLTNVVHVDLHECFVGASGSVAVVWGETGCIGNWPKIWSVECRKFGFEQIRYMIKCWNVEHMPTPSHQKSSHWDAFFPNSIWIFCWVACLS